MKVKTGMLKATRGLLLGLVLSGCTSTRQFTSFPETNSPPPGRGRIYALHPESTGNFAIADGNKLIGEVAEGGYLAWDREPGTATIITGALMRTDKLKRLLRAHTKKSAVELGLQDSSVTFNYKGKPHTIIMPVSRNVRVEAGKTYYVVVGAKSTGWRFENPYTIDAADEKAGSALLVKSKKPKLQAGLTD
jgi:hypothetical protein